MNETDAINELNKVLEELHNIKIKIKTIEGTLRGIKKYLVVRV